MPLSSFALIFDTASHFLFWKKLSYNMHFTIKNAGFQEMQGRYDPQIDVFLSFL